MLGPLMVIAWLLFPLVMLAVCLGCGLLIERAGGWRLPGALLPSLGLAVAIVVAVLLTESSSLAPATTWVVVALAVLGCGLSWRRVTELRPDGWVAGVGVLVYAAFAAPIVVSGHPTFAGYGIDGDPAFHFLLARELLAHGHASLAQQPFPDSTANILMGGYLSTDYPVGADLAAGLFRTLVGQDLAWVYAPFIAVSLALGAVTIDDLLRGVVRSRPLRALCAFIAAQAGLAYGFYLVISIKELVFTWAISLAVWTTVAILRRPPSARALIPLAVVMAAGLGVLAAPALPWLAIPLIVLIAVSGWKLRARLTRPDPRAVAATVLVVVFGVAIALPVLKDLATSFNTTNGVLTTGTDLGFLPAPLDPLQTMGIWPSTDFRYGLAADGTLVHVLVWIAIASSVGGAVWAALRRAWAPLLLMLGNGLVALILLERASPYATAKVEAILSITAVFAAMLGAAALHDAVNRWLGWALGAVLALGVLWTNGQYARHSSLAPQPRFAELAHIDARFAGQGPTFYNLWDFEWPGYFLRRVGGKIPHILQDPPNRVGSPGRPNPAMLQIPWDPNDLPLDYVESFKLLVMGRSPTVARPPANFVAVDQGRYYTVWRRTDSPHVLSNTRVTSSLQPTRRLSCRAIHRLASRAGRAGARLAAAPQQVADSVPARNSLYTTKWAPLTGYTSTFPGALALTADGGAVNAKLTVARAGRYTLWLQGSLTQRVSATVNGHRVGSVSDQIGPYGLDGVVATITLPAGSSSILLHRSGASPLEPWGHQDALVRILLSPGTGGPAPVRTVAPSAAGSLCATPLQWVEVVR